MPNYCFNQLDVSGPQAELDEFIAAAAGPDSRLDFDRLHPVPAGLDAAGSGSIQEIIGLEQPATEHAWRCRNWGTKWAVADDDLAAFDHSAAGAGGDGWLTASFDTAGSPVKPLVAHCAARWPGLEFSLAWYEQGNGFAGCAEFALGVLVASEESEDEAECARIVLDRIGGGHWLTEEDFE